MNSPYEPSGVRLYLCGFERDEAALEVHPPRREKPNQPFQLSFNASLKVDFQGSRVTSDGGLILVRELDDRLGLAELITQPLTDSRLGKNTQLPLADLLRQSISSRLAGTEDVNDAERISQDPTFRLIGSEKIWERGAALTSRLQSFETELLTQEENLTGPAEINRELIAKAEAVDSPQRAAGWSNMPGTTGCCWQVSSNPTNQLGSFFPPADGTLNDRTGDLFIQTGPAAGMWIGIPLDPPLIFSHLENVVLSLRVLPFTFTFTAQMHHSRAPQNTIQLCFIPRSLLPVQQVESQR